MNLVPYSPSMTECDLCKLHNHFMNNHKKSPSKNVFQYAYFEI